MDIGNQLKKVPHKNFIEFINDYNYGYELSSQIKNTFSDIMLEDRNTPLAPFVPFQIRVKSKLRFGYKLQKEKNIYLTILKYIPFINTYNLEYLQSIIKNQL